MKPDTCEPDERNIFVFTRTSKRNAQWCVNLNAKTNWPLFSRAGVDFVRSNLPAKISMMTFTVESVSDGKDSGMGKHEDNVTPMYRYNDRDRNGHLYGPNVVERVKLEVIEVARTMPSGWAKLVGGGSVNPEFLATFAPTLDAARDKFLKVKLTELMELARQTELIHMSMDYSLTFKH